ncbi:2-oxoacid:ferredoxin oxidoreductase subunit beta [Glycomyces sp. L485]|uniref:2-oxoacid:ferredoxin oxidoreductase subunit beta n=1 Tax=Glycomyces sp. L485 TaxID=2909235 RepID=UPI001F4BA505|nr:2-oxoacid:ferredoxin oxidoreductase subunit beta [Glycomyces sp. L485]MCH7230550.1 2-oxoacid:ferredoxin oxidoreductase subunit beta [Glycomyces sp. L485]
MTTVDTETAGRRSGLALVPSDPEPQKAADYRSDQEVRWCPGCGDYIILNTVQAMLPELGLRRENIVFISGIGCSSRFPYYLDTYGMHSIHGRAPAIATGLAVARPDLSVWVITGDGDALSIGGNHLIHALRRNVNLKILLFNNRVYGLTKGQYSPTSDRGMVTKSSPVGSPDAPFNPVSLALGAEASFVARSMDSDREGLAEVLRAAAEHRGSALVEIYQNCPVFNAGAFDALKDPDQSLRRVIRLRAGEEIDLGPVGEDGRGTQVVARDPRGRLAVLPREEADSKSILVHDPADEDPSTAFALSRLSTQDLSCAVTGVFRSVSRPAYDDEVRDQAVLAREQHPPSIEDVIAGGDTWTVSERSER